MFSGAAKKEPAMQTAPLGAAREHAACPENCMFSSLDPACTLARARQQWRDRGRPGK
jgi:hypothetical protein